MHVRLCLLSIKYCFFYHVYFEGLVPYSLPTVVDWYWWIDGMQMNVDVNVKCQEACNTKWIARSENVKNASDDDDDDDDNDNDNNNNNNNNK